MTDRKEKTLKTMESFEKHKQPDPESVLEEELSELDLEEAAGAQCGFRGTLCVSSIVIP